MKVHSSLLLPNKGMTDIALSWPCDVRKQLPVETLLTSKTDKSVAGRVPQSSDEFADTSDLSIFIFHITTRRTLNNTFVSRMDYNFKSSFAE